MNERRGKKELLAATRHERLGVFIRAAAAAAARRNGRNGRNGRDEGNSQRSNQELILLDRSQQAWDWDISRVDLWRVKLNRR